MIKRRGFTLIESLAVIAIIGILLSLGGYIFTQAQAQARDAVRKSDLDQIAQAFHARYLDKTCTDQSALGVYPGETLEQNANQAWLKVNTLASYSDGCGSFTSYLPTIPDDVRSPAYSYYFNLSVSEKVGGNTIPAPAKHFRLATALEHQYAAGSPEQLECIRLSHLWTDNFGGQPYDCEQHVITLGLPHLIVAAVNEGNGTGGGIGGPGGDASASTAQNQNNNGSGGNGGGGNNGGTPGPYNYYLGQ